jgi:SET domain-containing protein
VKSFGRVYVGSARVGRGLFASSSFAPEQRIIRLFGRIVSAQTVWNHQGAFADNSYRFGPETYLDPGDEAGAYVNHSCRPTAAVRKSNNRLFLYAVAPIRRNCEIAIDYSTILGDDDIWTMRCACGERTCRGRIRNFGSLPGELRAEYAAREMVPTYILRARA